MSEAEQCTCGYQRGVTHKGIPAVVTDPNCPVCNPKPAPEGEMHQESDNGERNSGPVNEIQDVVERLMARQAVIPSKSPEFLRSLASTDFAVLVLDIAEKGIIVAEIQRLHEEAKEFHNMSIELLAQSDEIHQLREALERIQLKARDLNEAVAIATNALKGNE